MMILEEKAICTRQVRKALEGSGEGTVLLTTSAGTYFRISGQIFLICDLKYGVFPLGIAMAHFPGALGKTGQRVRMESGCLFFAEAAVRLHLSEETVPKWNGAVLPERFDRCARELLRRAGRTSMAHLGGRLLPGDFSREQNNLTPVFSVALSHLERLLAGQTDAVGQLLGLGGGLTPSMDDVLLGMLYTRLRCDTAGRKTAALRDGVLRLAPQLTNAVSAAFLQAVANGAPFGRLEAVLRGLSGQEELDLTPMLAIGSNSGSEMAFGALLAAAQGRDDRPEP